MSRSSGEGAARVRRQAEARIVDQGEVNQAIFFGDGKAFAARLGGREGQERG